MDKFSFDYSEYSDILHIHKVDHETKGSIELGDFALDFGSGDDIVGVEIEHASEFFVNVDVDKGNLKKLKSAESVIDNRNPQFKVIFLKLEFPTAVKKIPIPMTVAS